MIFFLRLHKSYRRVKSYNPLKSLDLMNKKEKVKVLYQKQKFIEDSEKSIKNLKGDLNKEQSTYGVLNPCCGFLYTHNGFGALATFFTCPFFCYNVPFFLSSLEICKFLIKKRDVNNNINEEIMDKVDLKVPTDIKWLGQWVKFDRVMPQGKIILNKNICGCGCTEYYLRNDQPVILVSPRKELINCKVNSTNRTRPLFYFDRSDGTQLDDSIKRMVDYIENPFNGLGFVPKILVTYDSLMIVADTLQKKRWLGPFTIIVDEFTCIFTDVKLKGNVELNLLHRLNTLQNRIVYISATPISECYLDELDEFKNMPYVTLIWDSSMYQNVQIIRKKMRNTMSAIRDIINEYKKNGYFKTKIIGGQQVYSKEAVFFLNSVKDTANIIKDCGLTPSDTLVICADDQKNRKELNKVQMKIGHVPNEKEYRKNNKTFTFVTKACFEGTDFYSDCSSTYIFADSNKENLCLDISIDLPQIVGRCRTESNPFRREIYYYYKTSSETNQDIKKVQTIVQDRVDRTNKLVEGYKAITNKDMLEKLIAAQKVEKYRKDYLDVEVHQDLTASAVFNKLAYLADMRAIEIKAMQYKTTYSVYVYLERNRGYQVIDQQGMTNDELARFYTEFMADGDFVRRMKLFVEFLASNPEEKEKVEAVAEIPIAYKNYYNIIGADRIRALNYQRSYLERELKNIKSIDNIKEVVTVAFTSGSFYTNHEVKAKLQTIYDSLGLKKKAKATDIETYINTAQRTRISDANGNRQKGYRI